MCLNEIKNNLFDVTIDCLGFIKGRMKITLATPTASILACF